MNHRSRIPWSESESFFRSFLRKRFGSCDRLLVLTREWETEGVARVIRDEIPHSTVRACSPNQNFPDDPNFHQCDLVVMDLGETSFGAAIHRIREALAGWSTHTKQSWFFLRLPYRDPRLGRLLQPAIFEGSFKKVARQYGLWVQLVDHRRFGELDRFDLVFKAGKLPKADEDVAERTQFAFGDGMDAAERRGRDRSASEKRRKSSFEMPE